MVLDFYSRPCGRGDGKTQAQLDAEAKFLLTPLREGRPAVSESFAIMGIFLLTPLREGRHVYKYKVGDSAEFLLTPLREGRPIKRAASDLWDTISTHAPAGGATWGSPALGT